MKYHFQVNHFYKIVLTVFVFMIASPLQAKTYLPSGCGTYISCVEQKNDKGELNGPQICTNYTKKDVVVIKANWVNDKLDQDFFCANDNGVPKVQAQYKMGELHGVYKEYDSSLKIWAVTQNYKDGKREGLYTRTLSEGRQVVKFFKKDQQYGYELLLSKDGKLLSKSRCEVENTRKDNSVCDRISIPGYEEIISQAQQTEASAKKAKENQNVETKYPNGKIKEKYKMVNGQIEGQRDFYLETGVLETTSVYKNGKKIEETVFFADGGQIKSKQSFKDSWAYKTVDYFQNGKVKRESVESKVDQWIIRDEFKEYFDNGQLQMSGSQLKGTDSYSRVYDGEFKLFSRDGKPFEEGTYDKGVRTGSWKRYEDKYDYELRYEKGQIIHEKMLEKSSGKVVKTSEFMPDGSLKSEVVAPGFSK